VTGTQKTIAESVLERLTRAMPEPRCELDHQDAWQLLIATILSAQTTDKRVNIATPELFRRWPTAGDLAEAPLDDVELVIRTTGFYRMKAKRIQAAARVIRDDFGGEVPQTIRELTTVPGAARKTANVVLGTAYGIPSGIAVDTHAGRVARCLGLTTEQKPDKVERDLCGHFPQPTWPKMQHRLILHGRYICISRKPKCAVCALNELCPARETAPDGSWEERADAMEGSIQP
jgi:endonuclease-3